MQCDSCGSEASDIASVQRIYLVEGSDAAPAGQVADQVADQAGGDAGGRHTVLDDIEQWCYPCRSLYPHRLVVEGGLDAE